MGRTIPLGQNLNATQSFHPDFSGVSTLAIVIKGTKVGRSGMRRRNKCLSRQTFYFARPHREELIRCISGERHRNASKLCVWLKSSAMNAIPRLPGLPALSDISQVVVTAGQAVSVLSR